MTNAPSPNSNPAKCWCACDGRHLRLRCALLPGRPFGSFAVTAPFVLGHEVVRRGGGGGGRRVASRRGPARGGESGTASAGICDYCRSGGVNLCRHVRHAGQRQHQATHQWRCSANICSSAPNNASPCRPQIDDGLGGHDRTVRRGAACAACGPARSRASSDRHRRRADWIADR